MINICMIENKTNSFKEITAKLKGSKIFKINEYITTYDELTKVLKRRKIDILIIKDDNGYDNVISVLTKKYSLKWILATKYNDKKTISLAQQMGAAGVIEIRYLLNNLISILSTINNGYTSFNN